MKMTMESVRQDRSLQALPKVALQNGMIAQFVEYYRCDNPVHRNTGVYFVVCPDLEYLQALVGISGDRLDCDMFDKLLEDQERLGEWAINPQYGIVNFTDYAENDVAFSRYMDCCRLIQEASIAKMAYYEFGYPLPDAMSRRSIVDLHEMNKKRTDTRLTKEMQDRYVKSYKKFVSHVYERYADNGTKRRLSLPFNRQNVSLDYFNEKSIAVFHVNINGDMKNYILERAKDFPDFVYHVDSKPSLHLEDISNKFKGNPAQNVWKDKKEYTEYMIAVPRCFEHLFYTMVTEFSCSNYPGQVNATKELQQPIACIHVSQEDMWNWSSLCTANNVPYYINHGDLEKLNAESAAHLRIAYSKRDEEMVDAIMARLVSSRRNFIPTTSVERKLASQNKPELTCERRW